MTRLASLAALAFILAACQPGGQTNGPNINTAEPAPTPPVTAANTAVAQPAPVPAGPFLTAEGYGPLRVGMTWEEAHAAMPSLSRQVEEQMESCYTAQAPELPGVSVMFEDRRLARVSAWEGATITVAEGVRVGAPEAAVRAAFGSRLTEGRHEYENPPAKYLTLWTTPNQRGVRFEINGQGVVGAIHGGGPQIEYVEGCA